MTNDEEIRLKILEIVIPTSSKAGLEKSEVLKPGGIVHECYNFVKGESPAKKTRE